MLADRALEKELQLKLVRSKDRQGENVWIKVVWTFILRKYYSAHRACVWTGAVLF